MDEIDRKLLAATEKGITLTTEPFNEIALRLNIKPEEVISRLIKLKKRGVIRRFGALMKPNNLGFSANALVAWKVPESRIQEIGEYLSEFQEISHCYERKVVPGKWQYNLYTVMHAQKRNEVQHLVEQISEKCSVKDYKILYSTRDLKRQNIQSKATSSMPVKNLSETNHT